MNVINVADAKAHLSKLIEMALNGKEVIIGKRNKPLIRLVPLAKTKMKKRAGGHLKGKIHFAADFDVLPKEISDVFEGLQP